MDVRTGSKSWGYSKRPRNWKKIMYRDLPATLVDKEIEEIIPEISEIEEIEEIPEVEEIEEKPKITARIEKPKITARISKPVHEELPRPLVDPALPATSVDFSFSYI